MDASRNKFKDAAIVRHEKIETEEAGRVVPLPGGVTPSKRHRLNYCTDEDRLENPVRARD